MIHLSVAIIGAGNIAGGYDQSRRENTPGVFSHAGAYLESGRFVLKSVYDINAGRAANFKDFWKVERAATSLEEICESTHDVVSVCTPDESHYEVVRALVAKRCCKTIFVEKPLATSLGQLEELAALAHTADIKLVVNFQRRHDPVHQELRNLIHARTDSLLSVSGHYMKGLSHIGVTMVDTLTFLCGYPKAVLSFGRTFNQQVQDFSYEFVLFYDGFTVSIKTIDADRHFYNYHIFEIDLLLADRRFTIVDNSRRVRETPVGEYAYAGVKVLDEACSVLQPTGYHLSMRAAAEYIHGITTGMLEHDVNTPAFSQNNLLILDRIAESYRQGQSLIAFDQAKWKK